jgi:ADP-heptose:LPS heptosyltransferase
MDMRTVKTIKNDKPHNTKINNSIVYFEFVPKIKGDVTIAGYFQKTIDAKEALDAENGGRKCKSCELNGRKEILLAFIADFKRCPDDKRAVAMNIMGDRQWVSHEGKWINIVTNAIEDIDQDIVHIPIVASTKNASKPQAPSVPPSTETPQLDSNDSSKKVTPDAVQEKQVEVESSESNGPKKYIFKNFQAPGDVVMMTAAIRDLHLNFPGKFVTDVRTNSMPIWESNKYITKLDESDPDVISVKLSYDLINQSNQGPYHFSEGFTENLEEILGVRIKRRIGRGHIQIGPNEENWGRSEREGWFGEAGYGSETQFWIINAGHKNDFTCKMWPAERYQQIVDHYQGKILFVQIGHKDHTHPKLDGVVNLVGKTDDRQLIRLVWASSGVVTPCSYPMTLAAAVPIRPGACNGRKNRPCVIVAGGREPAGWQAHTEHQFIHTCGMLPCCDHGGCWASRIKPIGDGDEKDMKNMCKHVVTSEENIEIDMYGSFYQAGRKKTSSYNQRG